MPTMPRALSVVLLLLTTLFAWLPRTAAACDASPSGALSYDLRLSPRAGRQCLYIVEIHRGASCEGAPTRSFELSCGETHRATITDEGAFISVLAPRAGNARWPIVRVFESGDAGIVVAHTLRLEDLNAPASIGPRPRVRVDHAGVSLVGRTTLVVPLSEVVRLARMRPVERRGR